LTVSCIVPEPVPSSPYPRPTFGALLRRPVHLLAFGLGSGLSPVGPGTAGTMLAVPLYLLVARFPMPVYAAVVAVGFAVGVWLCGRTARDLGVHDHPGIVWDEIIGYLLTMMTMPMGVLPVLAGFIAFRLFDILKPWPVGWFDRRVGGGLGIMLDDALAAGYAWLVLRALLRWWL